MHYIGRFAPSPTGPLHFGSLVAAVASYCDAKANNGKWLLRMENLDKPREIAGAADAILRQLDSFGFEWDAFVMYQSQRANIYAEYLYQLQRSGFVYSCTCSRKEIADSAILGGIDGVIYPKTCFNDQQQLNASNFITAATARVVRAENPSTNGLLMRESSINAGSWRINVDDAPIISFVDAIQGEVLQHLQTQVGDFILKRKDGIFAYQLAVVVDDALQNITHIVRGADLLDSTPRQIYLRNLLDFNKLELAAISYAHVPVAANIVGEKLSKQTLAKPIDTRLASQLIVDALSFLGQMPPAELKDASLAQCWIWATENWRLAKVPKQEKIVINL